LYLSTFWANIFLLNLIYLIILYTLMFFWNCFHYSITVILILSILGYFRFKLWYFCCIRFIYAISKIVYLKHLIFCTLILYKKLIYELIILFINQFILKLIIHPNLLANIIWVFNYLPCILNVNIFIKSINFIYFFDNIFLFEINFCCLNVLINFFFAFRIILFTYNLQIYDRSNLEFINLLYDIFFFLNNSVISYIFYQINKLQPVRF
jgi:hypothetical protein